MKAEQRLMRKGNVTYSVITERGGRATIIKRVGGRPEHSYRGVPESFSRKFLDGLEKNGFRREKPHIP